MATYANLKTSSAAAQARLRALLYYAQQKRKAREAAQAGG